MNIIRCLTLLLLFIAGHSYAYSDGVCYPSSGSPQRLNYNVTKTITAPENIAGAIVDSHSGGTGSFLFSCDCSSPSSMALQYWSSTALYPAVVIDGNNYLEISPELKVKVAPYIVVDPARRTRGAFSIPFSNVVVNESSSCGAVNQPTESLGGFVGEVRITNPIVGELSFSGPVGQIYMSRNSEPVNPTNPPMAIVYLDFNFTAPNNCIVRPGGVINVDLGQKVRPSQFKGRPYPQPPSSYTLRGVDLTFDCDFSNADVDVSLAGNPDPQGQGFASSSPDISVIVTDDKGTIIPPQSAAGYVTINESKVSNTLHLKAYPTNSGSEAVPQVSAYTATATIQLSYR